MENIPGHFKGIYSGLYNSVDDAEKMAKLSSEVEKRVGDFSLEDVSKVTTDIVKEAASKLKPVKTVQVLIRLHQS